MNINDLPPELLEKILSYLTVKEKFQCEQVCRHWQNRAFNSIKVLAFEDYYDVLDCCHQSSLNNWLSRSTNIDDNAMKYIITKCGKYLHSFRGFVSYATMLIIAEHCQRLQCVDMLFDDVKSMKVLSEHFGMKLTCATVYINLRHGIVPFLSSCPKLSALAVIRPRTCWTDLSDDSCSSVSFFDPNTEAPQLSPIFTSVRHLVVDGSVSYRTLEGFVLFTNLNTARVELDHDLNKSELWKQVMTNWSNLTSLSLSVSYENCIHFDPLPPNLEFLSLESVGRYNYDYSDSKPITLSSFLPKLRTLKIYQTEMNSGHLGSILDSVLRSSPLVESFWLGCYKGLYEVLDEQLTPLLALTSLKQLCLGTEFQISDSFASKLITDLDHLTSIGDSMADECPYYGALLPCGSSFLRAVSDKAKSRPSDCFNLTGILRDQLHLKKPLPSNVSLVLRRSAELKLGEGFGHSTQWRYLISQWDGLRRMTLEIKDTDIHLSGLPKNLEWLSISCLGVVDTDEGTFTFDSYLPQLEEFAMCQSSMSNQALQATVECLAKCCPNLQTLCFDRNNSNQQSADSCLTDVLRLKHLTRFCCTENVALTDEFAAKLVYELSDLVHFGCSSKHYLGIQCGPLFITALAAKASTGKNVVLCGGPTKVEAIQMLKPTKFPKLLQVFKPKPERKNDGANASVGKDDSFEDDPFEDDSCILFGLFD